MDGGRPVFPDFEWSSIVRSTFYPLLSDDLKTLEDAEALAATMFGNAEATFYCYQRKDEPKNALLVEHDFLCAKLEAFFYQHLSPRDFIQIEPSVDGRYTWDWQKEYVETRPQWVRLTLKLSAEKRRQLEVLERWHMENSYREAERRGQYRYEIFLSFASANYREATRVQESLTAAGVRVFMSSKSIEPGDVFAEVIRQALRESLEVWILVSPDSLKSEWVMTEWGAAWVLEKRIVPILFRCTPAQLPDRLNRFQCIDLHDLGPYIDLQFCKSSEKVPPAPGDTE